ncbi:MAG: DMT family transporter, partial [candidate division Zixibacteria bacterium]|nr:DMT family transporter [candidate division Zixibacteria bacterium]
APTDFLSLRLGIGAIVLALLNLRVRQSFHIEKRDLVIVLGAGVIGIIIHQIIQLNGLRFTSATNTGWILTLIPPVTGLLGWFFLKEHVRGRQILGLAIAMLGVVFFVSNGHPERLSLGNNLGDALALLSVFTWSICTIMTKARLGRYDPLIISIIHMFVGFLFFALIGGWGISNRITVLDLHDWIIIIAIGVIPSGLAYYWWNAGLKRLSAMNTSMFLFLEAIVASATGAALLGEEFTLPMIGFAVIIMGGVYVSQGMGRRKTGRAPALPIRE